MRLDHILHFFACWALVDMLAPFTGLHAAMFTVLAIGIAKEIVWDLWMAKGTPDASDLLADGAGILFASLWWSEHLLLWLWCFWVAYVMCIGFYRAHLKGRLHGLSLVLAAPFLLAAVVIDVVSQVTVATVFFFDWPAHWTVTDRLKAYKRGPDGWRRRFAEYFCAHMLDPFDPTGSHCDSDDPELKA